MKKKKNIPLTSFLCGLIDGLITKFILILIFPDINKNIAMVIIIMVGLISFIMVGKLLKSNNESRFK